MGKSYKKNPIIKDGGGSKKVQKAQASRSIRRKLKDPNFEISNGSEYQKIYETWNVIDWKCRYTKEDAIADYNKYSNPDHYTNKWITPEKCQKLVDEFKAKYPTLESWLNKWEKNMRRK